MIDLVCLVADKNMEAVVAAGLERHQALGIRAITCQVLVHPQRDSACYEDPTPLLRNWKRDASHALVLFDRAWEGAPDLSAVAMEVNVGKQLGQLGDGWAKAIVIDPELEVWLCRRSPHLDKALGWHGREPSLTQQLAAASLWPADAAKPADPKRAIAWALRRARLPRSSSIYRAIASTLGLKDCVDPSFLRFQSTLQAWFPRR